MKIHPIWFQLACILSATLFASIQEVQAQIENQPIVPPGLKVSDLVCQWPMPSASSSTEANPMDAWKLDNGGNASFDGGALHVTSEKANPIVSFRKPLKGDVLVQVSLSYEEKTNDRVYLQLFDRFVIGYHLQTNRFTLMEKTNADRNTFDGKILQEKAGPLSSLVDPQHFTISVALTPSKITVWLDNKFLFDYAGQDLNPGGVLRLRSGWMSDWRLTGLSIHQLDPAP